MILNSWKKFCVVVFVSVLMVILCLDVIKCLIWLMYVGLFGLL